MPRKPLIKTACFPYHVYARSNNREDFFIPLEDVWRIAASEIRTVTERYLAQIHAFVLMINHFHMLISTPNENIYAIMNYLMREISRKICKQAERINHVFGGKYRWSLIQDEAYYDHVYRYVYRNPVAAKIAPNVESYSYSSLQFLLRKDISDTFPIFDSEYVALSNTIPQDLGSRLVWLNTPYEPAQEELIRKGLRRNVFQLSKQNRLKKIRLSLETF